MGYSTPKKLFDLGEFLSQKASTRPNRKPSWQRRAAPVSAEAQTDEPPETDDEPEAE